MKKTLTICMLGMLAILFSSAVEKIQKSNGPPSCYAGEPPGNQNCTVCHTGSALNSGSAEVLIDLGEADSGYVPGKSYTITVSVAKAGLQRAGFQIIALQDNNDTISPGIFAISDAVRTQRLDKNNSHVGGCADRQRVWIEHTFDGITPTAGLSSWSYLWQAPAVPVGSITFHLAAIESNNNLEETGDLVYTRKKSIDALPVGISEINASDFILYPQPASDELFIRCSGAMPIALNIYDLSGKLIQHTGSSELQIQQDVLLVSTNGFKPGVYLLGLETKSGNVYRKIVLR